VLAHTLGLRDNASGCRPASDSRLRLTIPCAGASSPQMWAPRGVSGDKPGLVVSCVSSAVHRSYAAVGVRGTGSAVGVRSSGRSPRERKRTRSTSRATRAVVGIEGTLWRTIIAVARSCDGSVGEHRHRRRDRLDLSQRGKQQPPLVMRTRVDGRRMGMTGMARPSCLKREE
jgi:hypothetical protein